MEEQTLLVDFDGKEVPYDVSSDGVLHCTNTKTPGWLPTGLAFVGTRHRGSTVSGAVQTIVGTLTGTTPIL